MNVEKGPKRRTEYSLRSVFRFPRAMAPGRQDTGEQANAFEKRPLINIDAILAEIPAYKEFETGEKLQESGRNLLEEFPRLERRGFLIVREAFGTSTDGKDIDLIEIGPRKSKRTVMWVGTPHPNEAVGTLAIDFLSRYLCEHPEIAKKLDTKFVFIKNVDPDGFSLNKSWLKGINGKVDPLRYALGFYRSPYDKQPEFGLLRGAKVEQTILNFMKEQYSILKNLLPDSRLKQTIEMRVAYMTHRNATLQKELENPIYQQKATNADIFNAVQINAFYAAINLGQVYQLAFQAGEIGRAEEIKAYIEKVIDDINEVSTIRSIPLQKLVAIQVGAGLLVQQELALAS